MTSSICTSCGLTPTCRRAEAAILVVRGEGKDEYALCNRCGGGESGPPAVVERKGRK